MSPERSPAEPEPRRRTSRSASLAALRRESAHVFGWIAAFAFGWLTVGLARYWGLWGDASAPIDALPLLFAGVILLAAVAGAVRLPQRLTQALGAYPTAVDVLESLDDVGDVEAQFRTLSRCTPDVVGLVDEAGRVLSVSGNVQEKLGVTRPEADDWSLFDLVHPADRKTVRQLFEVSVRCEKPDQVICRIRDDAGNTRWVESSVKPVKSAAGAVQMIVLARDITGRIVAQESLRAGHQRVRALLEAIPDLIIRVHEDGTVIDVSVPKDMKVGIDPHRIRGERLQEVAPPAFAERVLPLIRRTVEEGSIPTGIYEVQVGQERRSREARFIRSGPAEVLIIVRDVTDRERASTERQRLATVVEQATDGVLIADGNGVVEYANPAYLELARTSLEEIVGRPAAEIWRAQSPPGLADEIEGEVRGGRTWRGRYRVPTPDGFRDLTATAFAVRHESGEIDHLVAVVRDITEEMQLRQGLLQAQRMESMGRLAGGVAHDFNNLLTVISGYAELALRNRSDEPLLERQLGEISYAAERAARVTRQLLAFSRRQPVQLAALDLGSIVGDLEDMLRRLVGERVVFHRVTDPDLPRTRADASQLEQVVVNLVLNARDAMPDGGHLEIAVRSVTLTEGERLEGRNLEAGRYVALEVRDTGTGMDEATRAQVFEPFFTTKERGKGSGLGLSAVYGIVRQAGGGVRVESERGRGTTVTVLLPAAEAAFESAAPRAMPAPPPGRDETVLVVEDDDRVRALASEVLEAEGYRVLTATDGVDALEKVRGHPREIGLVVTDLVMPRMGGAELVRRLRAVHPEIRVLYTSGYPESELGAEVPLAGLLAKPFTMSALLAAVHDALERG